MNTENLKKKLEEEKRVLTEELTSLGRKDPEGGEWAARVENVVMEADSNDLADRFEDYEEKNSVLPTLEKHLSDVNAALKKMEAGTYGTCEVCGAPIEPERLEANPSAPTCMAHMNG